MKLLKVILSFLVIGLVVLVSFLPFILPEKEQKEESPVVLSLWNIDGFEGGKGSRTAFLKEVASEYAEGKNIIFMIRSVTQEGYEDGVKKGILPDLLSFGSSLPFYGMEPLKGVSFPCSTVDGVCYAYPWCRGGYVLYTMSCDYNDIKESKIVISEGRNNDSEWFLGQEEFRNADVLPPLTAYVKFVNGEYDYLLGTQRDHFRFLSRNLSVKEKTLPDYNDLYQYISIVKTEHYSRCMDFIRFLTGKENQKKLSKIGLCGMGEIAYEGESLLTEIGKLPIKNDKNCFTAAKNG